MTDESDSPLPMKDLIEKIESHIDGILNDPVKREELRRCPRKETVYYKVKLEFGIEELKKDDYNNLWQELHSRFKEKGWFDTTVYVLETGKLKDICFLVYEKKYMEPLEEVKE